MKQISRLQFITQDVNGLSHLQQIEHALAGGCNWVQLRMKDKSTDEILEVANQARILTSKANAKLIINDSPEICKAVNADGVHLGKKDCSPSEAYQLLGKNFIIGATANKYKEVLQLNRQPVDYFGIGPYKFTTTKKNLSPVLGIEGYQQIVEQCKLANISKPMVAIGSVTAEDIPMLIATGMYGVAVSSAISKSTHPQAATQQILLKLNHQPIVEEK